MSENPIELETMRWQKMVPRELARNLMRLPPAQRLKTILDREDADRVVAAISEQDFFFCIKEIGQSDALPLLAMANLDQLNHIFDLEWWRKDQVVPARALEWLTVLANASEQKVAEWLFHADFELLVTLCKKWLQVEVLPEDADLTELREKLPKFTLDEQYFWDVRYPQFEDLVRSILRFLFETHQEFYRELMTHVVFALDTEFEELAHRFHRGRQEDHAIPDFSDALQIYHPVDPARFPHGKARQVRGGAEAGLNAPCFALALVPEKDLLGRALRQIRDPALMDTLQLELAALANKVVVADQLPADDLESLRIAVDKVAAVLNLGLDLMTNGDASLAAAALEDLYLEHLFRFAHGRLSKVRKRAMQLVQTGWISNWPHRLAVLETPWQERLELLQEKTPRMKRGQSEDFIRTHADLFQARKDLNTLIALGPVFHALQPEILDHNLDQWPLWAEAQVREPENLTLGVMLLTAAARQLAGYDWQVVPLEVEAWLSIFPALTPESVNDRIREQVRHWVTDPVRLATLEPYLEDLLNTYQEEISPFVGANPPDPKLVPFFLFSSRA